MEKYRSFLKGLLLINMMLILVVAVLGFRMEKDETTYVSGNVGKKVIPVGQTVGIYINTKGILVIDTSEVTDSEGRKQYPAKNKLQSGDYIYALNGEVVKTKKQLIDKITNCEGNDLVFSVKRNDKDVDIKIEPVETDVNVYKVGIWVRDDLQGLGTVTYVEKNHFAALGHSITDMDTGKRLDVSGGEIYQADIFGIERGKEGEPGEIEGMIAYQTENIVGHILDNQIYGIYGDITDDYKKEIELCKPIEICEASKVKKGKAYIQSYVSGKRKQYEIEIVDIHVNENGDNEMEIQVTDSDLLSLTGGIVQGMSGSPIIQDGKLVGAVTHVFVNDPTRGYGIFIEEMMEEN